MFHTTIIQDGGQPTNVLSNFPKLRALCDTLAAGNSFLVTDAQRTEVPPSIWALRIQTLDPVRDPADPSRILYYNLNYNGSGVAMAENIISRLSAPAAQRPAHCVIDELFGPKSQANGGATISSRKMIAECARYLSNYDTTHATEFRSKVHVYFARQDYSGILNAQTTYSSYTQSNLFAVDEILKANLGCLLEFYISQTWYCNNGDTGVRTLFRGTATDRATSWLVGRRTSLDSVSPIRPIFSPANDPVATTSSGRANAFLDRLIYLWKTEFGTARVGSWKWHKMGSAVATDTAAAGRDTAFYDAWNWYQIQGKTTPRVPGPYC